MVIKDLDSIIAIEILKDTYKIDLTQYNRDQVEEIMELLQYALLGEVLDKEPENT